MKNHIKRSKSFIHIAKIISFHLVVAMVIVSLTSSSS